MSKQQYDVKIIFERGSAAEIKYVDEAGCFSFYVSETENNWTISVPGQRWNKEGRDGRSAGALNEGKRQMTSREHEVVIPRIREYLLHRKKWFGPKCSVTTQPFPYDRRWDEPGALEAELERIRVSIPQETRDKMEKDRFENGVRFFVGLFLVLIAVLLSIVVSESVSAWVKAAICGTTISFYALWIWVWIRAGKNSKKEIS